MKKVFSSLFVLTISLLLTGCQSSGSDPGFFQSTFVQPFQKLIHIFADLTGGSFGLAIILITVLLRLALMPMMLKQYKKQQQMKEKMDIFKPEMEAIQKRLKETKDPKEQQNLQQEMMGLYQKHGVNPLNIGCLPILIQMPILTGLYYAISNSNEIASHTFLWFNLGQPDLWITAAAGIVYYLQFKVSQASLPVQQQQQMKFMGLLSPAMIVIFSLNAPAALPLYWTVGGAFLVLQTLLSKKIYRSSSDSLKAQTEKA
ncbi:membrane protein insertase YidC [Mesobacillus foraminis]|uniref:membrane protein insertase YidC n=1 Tax=Mesobacillus foraminis TaxID=279826 RepID=UPI001BE59CFE|nr:membrane protein insertase YidC [Mesobacillus foraminis]MBT2757089.1 membrane protein insertase YidC [Mesobacillus foraminis]